MEYKRVYDCVWIILPYCSFCWPPVRDLRPPILDFFCASSLCGPIPRDTLNETEVGEVVKCMVYWLKAAMCNNLQLLQYSEPSNRILCWQLKPVVTIEFGVDNRWKLAREGRMVQNRQCQRCQATLWSLLQINLIQLEKCSRIKYQPWMRLPLYSLVACPISLAVPLRREGQLFRWPSHSLMHS